ncbi:MULTISPECIES: hypothetical protein [unclassified Microcoleus]|uniref:hypothetical protein n=1 Tax=unclassified Microcoleus TaxID=2642155 RepID=UPI002FD247A7
MQHNFNFYCLSYLPTALPARLCCYGSKVSVGLAREDLPTNNSQQSTVNSQQSTDDRPLPPAINISVKHLLPLNGKIKCQLLFDAVS